jgi:hypothetical protein
MRTRLGRAVRTTYRGTTGEIKLQQIQGQIQTLSSASSAEAKRVEVMHGRLAACLPRSVEMAQDDAKLSAKLEMKAGRLCRKQPPRGFGLTALQHAPPAPDQSWGRPPASASLGQ